MPVRYTAQYRGPDGVRFHCSLEFGQMGWNAYIYDLLDTDEETDRAVEAFRNTVTDADVGKSVIEEMLRLLLWQNDLPVQPLNWKESGW